MEKRSQIINGRGERAYALDGEGEKITRITVGGKKLKGWFLQDSYMRAGLPLDIYVK